LEEGDSSTDAMDERINDVKKHTETTIEPVVNSVEELTEIIKIMQARLEKMSGSMGLKD